MAKMTNAQLRAENKKLKAEAKKNNVLSQTMETEKPKTEFLNGTGVKIAVKLSKNAEKQTEINSLWIARNSDDSISVWVKYLQFHTPFGITPSEYAKRIAIVQKLPFIAYDKKNQAQNRINAMKLQNLFEAKIDSLEV